MSDRTVRLLAPEGTEIGFVLATVGERAVAYMVDVVLSQVILLAVLIVGVFAAVVTTSEHIIALLLLGIFVVRYGYFLFFETLLAGSTPGKRAMSLRVVSRDGAQLGLEAIVARNVTRDLEVLLPILLLVAPEQIVGRAPAWLLYPAVMWVGLVALLPLFTRERTRAGDLVAGTIVVRVPRGDLRRDEARGTRSAPIRFSREQLAIYGEHELETLATVLRSWEDSLATEDDLRVVAAAIARRIRWTGPEPERAPETFLRAFYRDQRTELERLLVLGKRIADKHRRAPPRPDR